MRRATSLTYKPPNAHSTGKLEFSHLFQRDALSHPMKFLLDVAVHAANFRFFPTETAFGAIVFADPGRNHEDIDVTGKTNRTTHQEFIVFRRVHVVIVPLPRRA